MTIEVKYSCRMCGINRRTCQVPERTEGEDIVKWTTRTLATAVQADHLSVSPHCRNTKIDEVMIPMDGRDKIGGPAIQ